MVNGVDIVGESLSIQMFVGGVFGYVVGDLLRNHFGGKQSDIGIHSPTGKILKIRTATVAVISLIFVSTLIAAILYTQFSAYLDSIIPISHLTTAIMILSCVVFIMMYIRFWVYRR